MDINNNNVEEQLSRLVSLSADQVINGTFYFPSVRAEKGLKADKATVGGNVEGIQLPSFTENVLLNGIDQKIGGYLDFNKLVIKRKYLKTLSKVYENVHILLIIYSCITLHRPP